jgi:single-strand DNA-binding protein
MNVLRNHVQLIGRLGQDIELRQMSDGTYLARGILKTREIYRDDAGEKTVDTQWHKLVGWGRVAEMMHATLAKDASVAIQGRLVHRTFERDQRKVNWTEVMVREFLQM